MNSRDRQASESGNSVVPTGRWPARISLALTISVLASLLAGMNASGQQSSSASLPTIGVDVQSASITQATYTLVVRNQGTGPSTNVRVRSNVPATMTFESSDPDPTTTTSPGSGAASCADAGIREPEGTTCEWSLGTLNPGESRTIISIYNLPQTNVASDRFEITATVSDGEGRSNSDTDESLVRQRATPNKDTWVHDGEPPGTNHGSCNYLRVLQANAATSFIDLDSLGTPPTSSHATQSIEAVYGAQLRLEVLDTTYSEAMPGTIGAHRITSGDWTQGGGSCQGSASTTNTDPRTGAEPTSAATATGTTVVRAATDAVNFDVTGDLDTEGERGSFQGWELRDQTSIGTDNTTRFHSSEAADADDPQLFWVYTTTESPSCIDADPDDVTRNPVGEHLMTAFVTDGDKMPTGNIPGAGTGPGGDACSGGPVAAPVEWVIEDDTPDIYFSSEEGQPIQKVVSGDNAGPNSIVTTADGNGVTSAGVRLDVTPGEDMSNRIEALIQGATGDPDPASPADGACATPTSPQGENCSGESHQFDDMTVTWTAQQSSRTISLFAEANEVVYPAELTLSGQIVSADSSCEDVGEFVQIRRRVLGEGQYTDFGSDNTDVDGRFELSFASTQSAEYVAVAPGHEQCADASSSPEIVEVKVKITAQAGRSSVERGSKVAIVGRVQPDHDGTDVLLQRKRDSGWQTIDRDELNDRSRFRFVVSAGWRGRRTFRVLWRAQDDEHAANKSRNVVITATQS